MKTPDQRIRPGFWLGAALAVLVIVVIFLRDGQQGSVKPADAASAVEIPATGNEVGATAPLPRVPVDAAGGQNTGVQVRLNVSSEIGAFPRVDPREHAGVGK